MIGTMKVGTLRDYKQQTEQKGNKQGKRKNNGRTVCRQMRQKVDQQQFDSRMLMCRPFLEWV